MLESPTGPNPRTPFKVITEYPDGERREYFTGAEVIGVEERGKPVDIIFTTDKDGSPIRIEQPRNVNYEGIKMLLNPGYIEGIRCTAKHAHRIEVISPDTHS